GPLPQTKVQVEKRAQTKPFENDRMARLRRPVRGDETRGDSGLHGGRDDRRGARDEPVEYDRDPARGGSKDQADERRDLEATQRGEDPQWVVGVGPIDCERALDDDDLAPHGVVVETSAPPG